MNFVSAIRPGAVGVVLCALGVLFAVSVALLWLGCAVGWCCGGAGEQAGLEAVLGFRDEEFLLKPFTLLHRASRALVSAGVVSKGLPGLLHSEFIVWFK